MRELKSTPHPARTYAEAVACVEALKNRPTASSLFPTSATIFLNHGKRTQRGIVFFHGYTNSPHQFRALGERFHARGYNVLIPRMPHHGLADRLTEDLGNLTAESLIQTADAAIDAAAGLTDEIIVMGLSMGGVLTAWAAQERDEVDTAVVISPAFGVNIIPNWLIAPLSQLFRRLPNRFLWWGEEGVVEGIQPHTYPRMASRGLAELWRLGLYVRKSARRRAVRASRVILILNHNDESIDYEMASVMERLWRRKRTTVRRFEFMRDDGLEHDLIDPENPLANTNLVYPILEQLVENG